MKFAVAAAQLELAAGQKRKNISRIENTVKSVKQQHPDVALIVFPECALSGYECPELYMELGEEYPQGEALSALQRAAAQNRVHIAVGFVEKAKEKDGWALYNSAMLVDDGGNMLGRYRKVHLVEGMEDEAFYAGCDFPVFDTKLGKIGIMICWDAAFPEATRLLALHGAEIILVPEAVEKGFEREWETALAARAFDNSVYLISCNHAGADRTIEYFGASSVYDPYGKLVCRAGEAEEILVAALDTEEVNRAREYCYMLRRRRPELYGDISK